jgi:hypothetical protein
MPNNLETQVDEEFTRITTLRSTLDTGRTPCMKWKLGLALHILQDAKDALGDVRGDASNSDWHAFAALCLQLAMEKRREVEETVNKYGGPANVVEVGG